LAVLPLLLLIAKAHSGEVQPAYPKHPFFQNHNQKKQALFGVLFFLRSGDTTTPGIGGGHGPDRDRFLPFLLPHSGRRLDGEL
jgi:hypothetical protein